MILGVTQERATEKSPCGPLKIGGQSWFIPFLGSLQNKPMWFGKLLKIWPQTLASLQAKLPHTFWSSYVELFIGLWKFRLSFSPLFMLSHAHEPLLMLSHAAWDILFPTSLSGELLLPLQDVPQCHLFCRAPWHCHDLSHSWLLQHTDLSSAVALCTLCSWFCAQVHNRHWNQTA